MQAAIRLAPPHTSPLSRASRAAHKSWREALIDACIVRELKRAARDKSGRVAQVAAWQVEAQGPGPHQLSMALTAEELAGRVKESLETSRLRAGVSPTLVLGLREVDERCELLVEQGCIEAVSVNVTSAFGAAGEGQGRRGALAWGAAPQVVRSVRYGYCYCAAGADSERETEGTGAGAGAQAQARTQTCRRGSGRKTQLWGTVGGKEREKGKRGAKAGWSPPDETSRQGGKLFVWWGWATRPILLH